MKNLFKDQQILAIIVGGVAATIITAWMRFERIYWNSREIARRLPGATGLRRARPEAFQSATIFSPRLHDFRLTKLAKVCRRGRR